MTAREKVAAFLLDLARRIGRPAAPGITIDLVMNREDIADHLGMNAETVSRVLSRLKAERFLDMPKPGTVILREADKLADLSPLHPIRDDDLWADAV